ncbi:MAG: 4Fe-4S binding protein [Dehalococcoidia bacterium]|nr:4Fe-4S binding protein [Dehalococcoidia bacterium]
MFESPVIDTHKCDGCGLCVSVCHLDGLAVVAGLVAVVGEVECDWCADCEIVCPTGAISCPFEIIILER